MVQVALDQTCNKCCNLIGYILGFIPQKENLENLVYFITSGILND